MTPESSTPTPESSTPEMMQYQEFKDSPPELAQELAPVPAPASSIVVDFADRILGHFMNAVLSGTCAVCVFFLGTSSKPDFWWALVYAVSILIATSFFVTFTLLFLHDLFVLFFKTKDDMKAILTQKKSLLSDVFLLFEMFCCIFFACVVIWVARGDIHMYAKMWLLFCFFMLCLYALLAFLLLVQCVAAATCGSKHYKQRVENAGLHEFVW